MNRLRKIPGVEVIPIHLYKNPCAQVYSWEKGNKFKTTVYSILRYWAKHQALLFATPRFERRVTVAYEDLCRDPWSQVQRIAKVLDIEYQQEWMSRWGQEPMHVLGGNHLMKSDSSSTIRLDEKWRERLSAREIRLIDTLGAPVLRELKAQSSRGSVPARSGA